MTAVDAINIDMVPYTLNNTPNLPLICAIRLAENGAIVRNTKTPVIKVALTERISVSVTMETISMAFEKTFGFFL